MPNYKFALMGEMPGVGKSKRTPAWEETEEGKIFNPTEDIKFLQQQGIKYTKTNNGYYLDDKGKYLRGVIYSKDKNGNWNNYEISNRGIGFIKRDGSSEHHGSYDLHNLSLEELEELQNLGLEMNRFYKDDKEYNYYKPDHSIKFNNGERKFGKAIVTYNNFTLDNGMMNPSKANLDLYNKSYSGKHNVGYGEWQIVDPDNNYDYVITGSRMRDGGTEYIQFSGKQLPNGFQNGARYRINSPHGDLTKEEIVQKNNINTLLKRYGIQFKKGGVLGLNKIIGL